MLLILLMFGFVQDNVLMSPLTNRFFITINLLSVYTHHIASFHPRSAKLSHVASAYLLDTESEFIIFSNI